jgi:outer membrane protein, multidrug efflux system
MRPLRWLKISAWVLPGLLGGCSLAPEYSAPKMDIPETYKEIGHWTVATPADTDLRGEWWDIYNDPVLDGLEKELDEKNPDIEVALLHYDEALGTLTQTRAALVPEVEFAGNTTRNRQSEHRPLRAAGSDFYGNNLLEGSISYEFDLWGRVRNQAAAAKSGAQASKADMASVRLSLEATLADAYFALRGLDAEKRLLVATSVAYQRALELTMARHAGGAVSGIDVGRARTQLEFAHAQIAEITAQRALREHEVASLIGTPASLFSLDEQRELPEPPVIPLSAPSLLVQRRPDIAAAERRAAAANAEIGVARAAYFPTITLDASGGFQTNSNGVNLLSVANSFWTLGPAFALTIFDAGRRRAGVKIASDRFDEACATYRATVLRAFQEVEDNLALVGHLADEEVSQQAAVDAASYTEALSLKRYQQGAVTYLDVVTAQTADLDAQRSALNVATRRLFASVNLVRALGGGWSTDTGSQESASNASPDPEAARADSSIHSQSAE